MYLLFMQDRDVTITVSIVGSTVKVSIQMFDEAEPMTFAKKIVNNVLP